MEEIWKDIEGFEKYQVSNLGKVYSRKVKRLLIPQIDGKGYLRVKLWKDSKGYTKKVHRLVAQAFIPNPNNLPQVNHKDENKKNNAVDNLEWCTDEYNRNYGTRNERATKNLINRECESIPVQCVETGVIYPSIQEAYRQTNIKNISLCCGGRRNTAGGYHWKYVSNIRRINGFMKKVAVDNIAKIGDKIYVPNERNGYIVRARDDRYIICTKKIGKDIHYFIIDLIDKWRAPDDRLFCSGYETVEQCEERLKELQQGIIGLSRKRGVTLDVDVT